MTLLTRVILNFSNPFRCRGRELPTSLASPSLSELAGRPSRCALLGAYRCGLKLPTRAKQFARSTAPTR